MESLYLLYISRYMDIITYIIKIFFINICTYFTFLKIINIKNKFNKNFIIAILLNFLIVIFVGFIKYKTNSLMSTISLIILSALVYSKLYQFNIGYAILVNTISLSINYVLFFISLIATFCINIINNINNDYINMLIIGIFDIILIYCLFKIKRFKYGFLFLQERLTNEYFDIIILNICFIILTLSIVFTSSNLELTKNLFFGFIIFVIIMFITIQKSLQLYYKQKLLKQNLEESKKDIENKDKKIEELGKENFKLHKKIHSINHSIESLEYKLDMLSQKSEIASEIDIRDRINEISKMIEEDKVVIELTKTNIEIIDDILKNMQSKCIKNNIDFELKINGNIHHMINNIISKKDLEILIADLIKNAIIAISYSDNVNKSILVRLGVIDGIYSLYVYDTGIEFNIETLLNLGIKPSTTHADNGGTGMGFINAFDTLNKYKASIIIEEFGKESKDNYTKAVIIKFDKNNNYKINSYRAEKIKEKEPKNIIIEKS